ncbi:MAG: LLM class flavin-dependent oxidoreductase [Nocardioides sp.]|uniref:LLM class flavin-dependent oxidoreductase n=1 Tax=Nocardioides sp. TaxID=35761 RepID=UPI0039E24BEC
MQAAVHLPQMGLNGTVPRVDRVVEVAAAARDLGLAAVSANDHLAFSRPWLDGPTLLAAVARDVDGLELATTVALPVLRGPAQLAATFAGLAALAPGRVVAGLGPGSSPTDFALARTPFDERFTRFDEAIAVMRDLLRGGPVPASWGGPLPDGVRPVGNTSEPIPLWLASWGSAAGLRRVARLGDGWLASAYNTTPDRFADAVHTLDTEAARRGREAIPAALATMWTWITDDEREARQVVDDLLAPTLGRDPQELAGRVSVGTPERCADLLSRYAASGCSRVYFWPVRDEVAQLHRLVTEVLPRVRPAAPAAGRQWQP